MNEPSDRIGESAAFSMKRYWRESTRPLVSLAFVLPLLIVYETGLLLLGPPGVRNGVEAWLRGGLEAVGLGAYFLLPALVCFVLAAWHHTTRAPWRFSPRVLGGMWIESVMLALVLVGIARWQTSLARPAAHRIDVAAIDGDVRLAAQAADERSGPLRRVVAYCGAGIYEEWLFRLLMLPAAAAGCWAIGASRRTGWITAVIVTSLLFAAAHYRLFVNTGDVFDWITFLFRFTAGVFFSTLFIFRGFGITAGTHALYDVFVAPF